jgi:hypothetical protein
LAPAAIVDGSDSPDIPKPAPDTVARFIIKPAFPLFVKVTV